MSAVFRSRRLLATGAAVALAASFVVAGGAPAGAVTYPPMTVSKTTAHSGSDHGDSIDETGSGCTGTSTTQVTLYLATGVVADDQPLTTDLTAFGYAAAPDLAGDWSGTYSVSGGGAGVLPAGQYTLRTGCYDGLTLSFVYAGVVITINGDAEVTTTTAAPTTTGDPGTTTTTAAGATTTTAASAATSAPAAAVAAQATFTG
jgi:hypothetical protein